MERDTRLHSLLLHLSLKAPSNWAPPPCSPTGSLWREKLHLQSQWFVPSFISVRFPNKEPSHEKQWKHLVTVHGAPRRRKAYIQWGAAWFPKGLIYDNAISSPVSRSLQHDTFHLSLRRPEPSQPACAIATLIRECPPQLLPPPTWPRVEYSMNPRYPEVRTRGWIYGRL